jgi:hypothetical protein
MKILVTVLAVLLLLTGLASLSFPWVVAVSIFRGEFDPAVLFFAVPILLYAWAAIGYSVAYLRKKKVRSAYSIATVTGFTVWALSSTKAAEYLEVVEDRLGLLASCLLLFLPVVLGIGVMRYLKGGIRKSFGNGDGEAMEGGGVEG